MKPFAIGSALLALAACVVSLFLMNKVLTLEARIDAMWTTFGDEKAYQIKDRVEMLERKQFEKLARQ